MGKDFEPGKYHAECIASGPKVINGKDCLEFQFAVVHSQDGHELGDPKYPPSCLLWCTTDKAILRTIAVLRYIGWEGEDFAECAQEDFFKGYIFPVECTYDVGKDRCYWDIPLPPREKSAAEPTDPKKWAAIARLNKIQEVVRNSRKDARKHTVPGRISNNEFIQAAKEAFDVEADNAVPF